MHGAVDDSDEVAGFAELPDGVLDETIVQQELLVDGLFKAPVLLFQQLGMLAVGREPHGKTLELVVRVEPEPFGRADRLREFGPVVENLFADGTQQGRFGAIDTRDEHVLAHEPVAFRCNVEVVAGISRLLAFRSHEDAQPVLVGTLVVGEPRVAGDPVGAVLHPESAHRRIERGDALDQRFSELCDAALDMGPFAAVGVEPLACVAVVQPREKVENLFHATRRTTDSRPSRR